MPGAQLREKTGWENPGVLPLPPKAGALAWTPPWGLASWDSPVEATSRMMSSTSTTDMGMKTRNGKDLLPSDFLVWGPGGGKSRRGGGLGPFPPSLPVSCRFLVPAQAPGRTGTSEGLGRLRRARRGSRGCSEAAGQPWLFQRHQREDPATVLRLFILQRRHLTKFRLDVPGLLCAHPNLGPFATALHQFEMLVPPPPLPQNGGFPQHYRVSSCHRRCSTPLRQKDSPVGLLSRQGWGNA